MIATAEVAVAAERERWKPVLLRVKVKPD